MMRNYNRFASLFTQDGAWRIPYINAEFVSREEIRAGIERMQGLWEYFVQTVHPGLIQLEGDTAVGRAFVSEFGHMRNGRSELNYSVPRPLAAHRGRLGARRARLRGLIPRHHSAGRVGAPRSEGAR